MQCYTLKLLLVAKGKASFIEKITSCSSRFQVKGITWKFLLSLSTPISYISNNQHP